MKYLIGFYCQGKDTLIFSNNQVFKKKKQGSWQRLGGYIKKYSHRAKKECNIRRRILTHVAFYGIFLLFVDDFFSTLQSLADMVGNIILAEHVVETSLLQLGIHFLTYT